MGSGHTGISQAQRAAGQGNFTAIPQVGHNNEDDDDDHDASDDEDEDEDDVSGDDGGRGENGFGLVKGGRGRESGTDTLC